MSWDLHHSRSESLAGEAEAARRAGERLRAEELYRQAANAEDDALRALASDKRRSRGITAVSAVALWYKGNDLNAAELAAYRYLASNELPPFAQTQLRELLNLLWSARAADRAGIRFVPGDVFVSVRGGEVIHGGAPLDLIVRKVEGIQAVLFRTVEMLLDRPFRRHGGPSVDIQSMFRPWLLQAPAGSYQFAVRVQEPDQTELWETARPRIEAVTATFFSVLRAAALSPDTELPKVVPDSQYREAFLGLSRNLAPTGKTFERLEIRAAGAPEPIASFVVTTRQQINTALRSIRPPRPTAVSDVPGTVRGILRAVHLDQDWIEVATTDEPPAHLRIDEAGDALDDVVGPMVNRRVIVTIVRRGTRLLYRDLELEE